MPISKPFLAFLVVAFVVVLAWRLFHGGEEGVLAGVVHEHVDPAEAIECGADERGRPVPLGEVARDGQGFRELSGELLEAFAPASSEHDPRAGGVEDACEPGAEPGARAGHDRDAPVETERGQGVELRHGRSVRGGTRA